MDSRESRKGKHADRGVEQTKSVLGLLGALSDGVIGCEPLKGAVGVAKELVEWIEKVRTNRKDCASLARQTYDFMYTIVMAVGEEGKIVMSNKLWEELAGVESVLKDIRDEARELGAQPFLKALLSRDHSAEKLKGFKEKLTLCVERFKMSSLIELRVGMHGLQLQQSGVAEFSNITISASLPAPVLHLLGRDSLISKAISEITGDTHNHLAILGTGGIGKTSLALAVLHSSAVKETFGDLRVFLPCDSVTAAGPLVFAILKTLGVDVSTAIGDPLAKLEAQIYGMKPFVIVLDNFETPWNSPNQDVDISNVLQRLSAVPQVHMIVTMRGNTPPCHSSITWTSLLPDMLSVQEATELFVRINPSLPDSEQPDLQKLLKELGGLPLAVKLLAELWQSSTCSRLLAQWKKKKTALLRSISGTKNRLTNLDISIAMSLESPIIAAAPQATELLYVLCHLPDGVVGGIDKLASMELSLLDLDGAISALYATGLVTGDIGESIKVPSPIQHYILDHPLTTQYLHELYKHYIALISTHSSFEPGNAKFLVAKAMLGPEIGNIVNLIVGGLNAHTQFLGLVDAAMAFTAFQYWECPSLEVINALMDINASTSVTADLYYKKARLHYTLCQDNYAIEAFSKARHIFITEGNTSRAAHCLRSLGNIYYVQDNYTEATTALNEAHTEFLAIGDHLGVAQCLQSLGNIYYMQDSYIEAITALQKAHTKLLAIEDRLGAAECLQSLGDIYRMQHNYSKATTALQEAQTESLAIGNRSGGARSLQSLGDIYYMQNNYIQASTALHEAQREFLAVGDRLGASECLQSLGDIYRMQHNYTEAITALQEAHTESLAIGNRSGEAHSLQSIGDIHYMQSNYTEANTALQEAHTKFVAIGDRLGAAHCLQSLGQLYRLQCQYSEAMTAIQESSTICQSIGHQSGLAWSHKHLAHTYWDQQLYKQALVEMHAAQDTFLQIEAHEAQANDCQVLISYWEQKSRLQQC